MSNHDGSFDWQQWTPAILVAVAGFLLFLGLSDGGGKKKVVKANEKTQASANEHLKRTAEKMEMIKRQQALRSWQLVNEYGKTVGEQPFEPPSEGAELQELNAGHDVARDLGRVQDNPDFDSMSASDLIRHQLFEAEIAKQQDKAYREQYARQFIENARRAGWEIKLDENYKVIDTKRIRRNPTNNQFELFK